MFRVFPAPAGINRQSKIWTRGEKRVPRASGDKPSFSVEFGDAERCSPRQRG